MINIAIIIPVFNRCKTTLRCLKQLEAVEKKIVNCTVVVVDDGSTDGTGDAIRNKFPNTIILTGDGNLWWTGAINKGVNWAVDNDYDSVLLLNDDLIFDDAFIYEIMQVSYDNKNALISSLKVVRSKGKADKVSTAGFFVGGFFYEVTSPYEGEILNDLVLDDQLECDLLTGASLFIPINVFKKIGLFDESKFPHNWGDFEFTRRACLRGYKCIVATKSKVYIDGDNPNYHSRYYLESTRKDYLTNLFDNYRYNYGFSRTWYISMMHKPVFRGIIFALRRFIGLVKNIILKIILPKSMLMRLARKNHSP